MSKATPGLVAFHPAGAMFHPRRPSAALFTAWGEPGVQAAASASNEGLVRKSEVTSVCPCADTYADKPHKRMGIAFFMAFMFD